MSFRDANRRIVASRFPAVEAALAGVAPAEDLEIVPSDAGEPSARWRGVWLHSPRDPRREARAIVGREAAGPLTAAVLLGFGLGYAAECLLERYPGTPLLVVEPSAPLFLAALDARDLSPLLANTHLALLVGAAPEAVRQAVEGLPLERPAVLRLRAEADLDPTGFAGAEGAVRSTLLRREINTNTLARFGRLWIRNLAANLPLLADAPGVAALFGRFAGLPAVVVAGGPSLDEALPHLPKIADRALILSVNTPLAAVLAAGVQPDIVVVVDPQYWASRHLDWTSCRTSWIVAEPSTHPRSLRRAGRIFLTGSLFPLGQLLEETVGAKGRIGAGGSVSTAAWDLARRMGASAVYAAGLDLGYPGLRTHCRPAAFDETRRAAGWRLVPAETGSFAALHEIGLFTAPASGGGTVATDRRMLLYRFWFEEQVAASAGAAYVLSGRGVAIRGMATVRAEDLLALPPRRSEIEERKALLEREIEARPPAAVDLVEAVRTIIAELEELRRHAEAGVRRSADLARLVDRAEDPRAAIRALDRVDEAILGVAARPVAGFLVQDLIQAIDGGGRDGGREAVRAGAELYRGLADSARFQADVLRRAADRLSRA